MDDDKPLGEDDPEDIKSLLLLIIDLLSAGEDFVSDRELARRWHVSVKTARPAIRFFELNFPRFPKKDELFGNKRFWPAIVRFMHARYGLVEPGQGYPYPPDGPEASQADYARRRKVRLRPPGAGS